MLATRPIGWTADDMHLLEDFPDGYRYEASEGVLEVTPPPEDFHEDVADFLQMHLVPQALPDWRIRIQLSVRTSTGWRIPDLAALRSGTRATRSYTRRPADIGLVVEVVSASSRRRDRVVKREEYADVGIPYYWLVEQEPDLMIVAHELREGSYVEAARLTAGTAELPAPFPAVVDLDALRPLE